MALPEEEPDARRVRTEAAGFSPAFQAELARLFRWRRDVRRFRTDPLPEGLLDALLAEAATAPSVGLSEPWRLLEVPPAARCAVAESFAAENAAALAERGPDRAAYAGLKLAGLAEAPVHIAAYCDDGSAQGRGLGQRTMPETRRYSVVCAVMQLWLAARAHGVGLGWVSILAPEAVDRALDVPVHWHLVAYLCLGYPQEEHTDAELERHAWERRRAQPL
ncbi:MAG: 5,6-dimethylbenzimidazole synthase [Paracoccaceae bacterium]